MGQQQLLLLVLGIVIVGLAVVVGIQAFGENQKRANADALVNDGVRIASDIQAWKLKPAPFGGGADRDLSSVTWDDLGIQLAENEDYSNVNGTFELDAAGAHVMITGTNTDAGNTIYVRVCGTSVDDIATAVNPASGEGPAGC